MHAIVEKQTNGFLLRLRKQDTPTGVSRSTIEDLMALTGLSQTEVAHLALRQMADRYLPLYEEDDGPLTADQFRLFARQVLRRIPLRNASQKGFFD